MSKKLNLVLLLALYCFSALAAQAQSSAFTYQGRFTDATVAQPTNGTYNMQFALYDVSNIQQPQPTPITITNNSVAVTNGVFTVMLDFSAAAFTSGADRFLEIRVFNSATNGYATLAPRQQITSAPYAIHSGSAVTADNAVTATTASNNVLKSGDTMTGQLVLSGNPAVNLGAATKQYVDSADALKLSLSGGTMSGVLNLGGNKITSLATPTNGTDAANKSYVDAAVTPAPAPNFFGDGSDGNVTITTSTTLTRDMYYHNLTINAGQTLNSGGYRVFVSGTLTLANGARIARDGNDGGNGRPELAPGTLGGAGVGGDSTQGGGTETNSLGGSGGGGGLATPPAPSGGGGGVFRSALQALSGRSLDGVIVNGGAGGGGSLGQGGGGGGVVVVATRTVVLSGGAATISALGGSGTGAGAGGGGGGVVVVITTTPQPAGLTLSASGGGGGTLGSNGAAGFAAWLN